MIGLETIIGGVVGTAARSIPAILEHLDKKNERKHEVAMFGHQLEADKLRGQQQFEQTKLEGSQAFAIADIQGLAESLKGQAEMAVAAGGRAAAWSAMVRPIVTFQLMGLYLIAKLAGFVMACLSTTSVMQVVALLPTIYTANDDALLAGILAYWFMDRTIQKRG